MTEAVIAAPRAHRVIRNGIYNLIPQLWFIALSIFTTPFVLHQLGVDAYGLLSVASILTGYLAFLDLGLNLAIIRFVAASHATGETGEIERVLQTALVVFGLVAVVAAAGVALLAPVLAGLMRVAPALLPDAIFTIRLAGLSFGISLVLGVFSAVPRALQRFDIVNAAAAILGTTQVAMTLVLLFGGGRLRALMIAGSAVSSVALVVNWAIARRLLPAVSIVPRFHAPTLRRMFGFSGYVMVSNFTATASANSEKLILGGMAPIAEVSYYAVPFNLVSRVLTVIPSNLFAVLFPALSALIATDGRGALRDAYTRAFRFILVAVAPISILLIAFGHELFTLWLGPEIAAHSAPVLAVLALALVINAPAWVAVTVGQSAGRPGVVAAAQVAQLVALVASGVVLVPRYGALGAAGAWLLGNCVGIPLLVALVNRRVLDMSNFAMVRQAVARPLAVVLAVGVPAYLSRSIVHGLGPLALAGTLVGVTYAAASYVIALDGRDRALIRSFVAARRPANGARRFVAGEA